MSDFNLDAFLASQQAEGTKQGEESGFTISHSKAASKMAQYSLPRQHAWVLKLVQAAVRWKCSSVRVQQTRTESTFFLALDNLSALPSNEELIESLLRADFESAAPVDALAAALRVVVEKCHLSFLLLIDRGEADPQAIYAGVFYGEMDDKKRALARDKWPQGLTLRVHHISHTEPNRLLLHYLPVRHHSLPMLNELDNYAYTCPVPITVDGRRIDGCLRSVRLGWGPLLKPLRVSGVRGAQFGPSDFSLAEGFAQHTFSVRTHYRKALRTEGGSSDFQAFYVVGMRFQRETKVEYIPQRDESLVYWVRDGVVVQEDQIKTTASQASVHIYANAAGLQTDLTGFQLVQNLQFVERKQNVCLAVAEALKSKFNPEVVDFEEDHDEFSEQDHELDAVDATVQRKNLAKKLALGGAVLMPVTGVIGALSLVGSVVVAVTKEKPTEPMLKPEKHKKILSHDLTSVIKNLRLMGGVSPEVLSAEFLQEQN